ncbi:Tat pathway signal sequence domain protein [Streptomyces sp. NPDC001941]|uniref:Tat pathway signal sequence domain protein n=1 Tax=Streptomyces sp. NPDC001941 TaxID=3154659 RepID=UPI0033294186
MVGITLPDEAGAHAPATRAAGIHAADDGPGPASVAPLAAVGERGSGLDPLTDAEARRAEALARAADRGDARDVAGGRGPQRLTVGLADPAGHATEGSAAPTGARRAEVRLYDYTSDQLLTRTVDLTTGRVERTTVQRGVQPSPHHEELREALTLILASPQGSGLRAAYRDATGRALTTPEQLWFNGEIYRTYREARVPAALARCGEHRCVRLVTKVRNGPWIELRGLVVDLSARTVVRTA